MGRFSSWKPMLALMIASPLMGCQQSDTQEASNPELTSSTSSAVAGATRSVEQIRVNTKPEQWEIQSGDELLEDLAKQQKDIKEAARENKAIAFEKRKLAEVSAFFGRYKPIPEVAAMKRFFGDNILISIYSVQSNHKVHIADEGMSAKDEQIIKADRHIEIIYYGEKDQNVGILEGTPGTHGYVRDWSAIMVPAIRFPDAAWRDAFFGGVLYRAHHDMKHGRRQLTNEESLAKEIAQRDTEISILDRATKGTFLTRTRKEASRLKAEGFPYGKLLERPDQPLDSYDTLDSVFAPANGVEFRTRDQVYRTALAREMIRLSTKDPEMYREMYTGFFAKYKDPNCCG